MSSFFLFFNTSGVISSGKTVRFFVYELMAWKVVWLVWVRSPKPYSVDQTLLAATGQSGLSLKFSEVFLPN